ncbi:MAG: response regulator [Deltaproteobacteria bacterium]|nr:response regulator [Deltaproteobacteria bacterium]
MTEVTMHILLVEDNPGDARLIKELLRDTRSNGFDLASLPDLESALDRLARGAFDVVLLDLSLPDSNGLDTLAAVHAQAPRLPIVVLTGLDDEGTAIRALAAGAQDFLLKADVQGPLLVRALRYAIERKRIEEQLLLQSTALAAVANAIAITDTEGRIGWVNAAFCRLTGYATEEVIGHNPRELIKSGKHDATFYKSMWDTILAGQVWRGETINRRQDGALYTELQTITPVRGADGKISNFIAVKDDITARLQLEDHLRLAQKMEALGTLAGGIAHDFNNILGAIIGNAQLARLDIGPDHPASESLDEIRKAGQRAKDLVQRILMFGRQRQQPQGVIELRPVVEEAVALLRATLPAGVELVTTFAADTPAVLADPTQIHQVLMNLCTNAWHALGGRNGRIEIRLDGVTIDAEAARTDRNLRPGRFARLRVIDNGVGMDAATLERIFDPFFTTKPLGEGTGLGLSVVHGSVAAHGGAITVASHPGAGTTFTVYLPAAETPQYKAATEEAAIERVSAGGQHVLYLDDEESLVLLATRLLERLGYRVSGHTRAADALAAVRADPAQFDLVVSDLNMPGASGLDVARELARLRPDLPVVLASGYVTDELRAKAAEVGVRQVIYKPNTVEELCQVIQGLTGGSRRT